LIDGGGGNIFVLIDGGGGSIVVLIDGGGGRVVLVGGGTIVPPLLSRGDALVLLDVDRFPFEGNGLGGEGVMELIVF